MSRVSYVPVFRNNVCFSNRGTTRTSKIGLFFSVNVVKFSSDVDMNALIFYFDTLRKNKKPLISMLELLLHSNIAHRTLPSENNAFFQCVL